ncbi:MAG: hypothetical protein Q8865_07250 [Bacillota bacterium]|nr:hypothetical protein [Bacillota bacterium]
MYKQEMKAHPNFLILIGFSIFVSLMALAVLSFLKGWLYYSETEAAIILLNFIYIIKAALSSQHSYIYRLVGNSLFIKVIKRKKEKLLADIDLSRVCSIKKTRDSLLHSIGNGRSYVAELDFNSRYKCVYRDKKEKTHTFIFQPDNQLMKLLKQSLDKNIIKD